MPPTSDLQRRLLTVARWPVGLGYTSFVYLWRTTPLHRREIEGTEDEDGPPPLPDGVSHEGIQRPEDGAGPLLHRTYTGQVVDADVDARTLIGRLQADPDLAAPNALANFQKEHGDLGVMRVGDEFTVRMPGPYDGPVRVVDVTSTSHRFATCEGHLEAGQIEWSAEDLGPGELRFTIESWARSGDRLSALMHGKLRMAKEVQLHMWTSTIEHVAEEAGGRLQRGVDIETRRVDL